MPTNTLRVLVTGGTGLIGTAVCAELRHQGHDVRTLDLTGAPDVRGDVRDPAAMEDAVFERDVVIHAAGLLGVGLTESARCKCLDVNVGGTRSVLEAAAAAGVRRVVYLSSSEVYGDGYGGRPVDELCPPQPKSVYAAAKLAAEHYVRAYGTEFGFEWVIIRPFNVYGPGQRTDFVVARFAADAHAGRPLTVHGSGEQTRSFCHVADAARGIAAAATTPNASGIYNIGHYEPVSIAHLASMLSNSVTHVDAGRDPDRVVDHRAPDCSRAARELGYVPTVGLFEGLASMH